MATTTVKNTPPFLTRYEYTGLIAARACELADGSPSTIPDPGTRVPYEIAEIEFKQGKMPKKIVRQFPDGRREVWNLADLKYLPR